MRHIIFTTLAVFLLSGCSTYRNFQTPEVNVDGICGSDIEVQDSLVEVRSWREIFPDPILQQLIEKGGGYSVADYESFRGLMDEFLQYDGTLSASGQHAGNYVKSNSGVVDRVMEVLVL